MNTEYKMNAMFSTSLFFTISTSAITFDDCWKTISLFLILFSVLFSVSYSLSHENKIYASQNIFGFFLNYAMSELGRLSSWVHWIYDNITARVVGFGLTFLGAL